MGYVSMVFVALKNIKSNHFIILKKNREYSLVYPVYTYERTSVWKTRFTK